MGHRYFALPLPFGGEELVDRLRQAEMAVAVSSLALLMPSLVMAFLRIDPFSLAALLALGLLLEGTIRHRELFFLAGAGTSMGLAPFVVEGPPVLLVLTLSVFAVLAGHKAIRLLRMGRGGKEQGNEGLARDYLFSVGWLGFELLIGGAVALLVVLASPIWHNPSWTALELGVALVAALLLATYWLVRTREEAGKG